MGEWGKTLVTSSVVAGIVSGVVSFGTISYKVETELHSKQSEAGYEELVKANTLLWQSERAKFEAERTMNKALLAEARKQKRESDASYIVAQHKIAAFGHARVVKALSDYYFKHGGAAEPCDNKEKFASDVKIYKAIRETLGVGGDVNDEQLAHVLFLCSLK